MNNLMKGFITILFAVLSTAAQAQTVDVNGKNDELPHYWSVGTCAGRANEGLRATWADQLQDVVTNCGFQYLRMHGVFDDDMCVYGEDAKGNPIYNWQYVDDVYDRMLRLGIRPFVELSFFPKGIAADNSLTQMWYQNRVTYDPARLGKWEGLVGAFARHMVDRYGIEEVANWYFEVWNEPNLNFYPKAGFFDGKRSDYFDMYRVSARAIKAVDKRLRVGGPATSNFIADHRHDGEVLDNSKSVFYDQEHINQQQWKGVWIEDFLQFCSDNHLPVDFISCHTYPTDYALDPVSGKGRDAIRYVHSVRDDLNYLRTQKKKYGFDNAEIHITEFSTSPNSRDRMHDLLPPAAYVVKVNLECVGLTNSLMYWTFTDIFEEKGGGMTPFHGGFGMMTIQGIHKPSYHAYRMLHQLGDRLIYNEDPLVVSKCSDTGKVVAIAYNYPEEFEQCVPSARNAGSYMSASAKSLDVSLTGLKPGAEFLIETMDENHGNAIKGFREIGSPSAPTREQTQWLIEQGDATDKETLKADGRGILTVRRSLSPWSVVLIKEI